MDLIGNIISTFNEYYDSRKLEAFEMRCLRAIFVVKLRDRVRNEAMRTAQYMNTPITYTIKTKMLKWFGHVARRPLDNYMVRASHLDLPNPRPRGNPPKKCCIQIREDTGLSVSTAERRASSRLDWRREVTEKRGFGEKYAYNEVSRDEQHE